MPQDKNTRIRHNFLDKCFRNDYFSVDSLLEKLNDYLDLHGLKQISERTLRGDIFIFESDYGAQFNESLKEGKKRLYHYLDEKFSINKYNELSDSDKNLLRSAAMLLSQVDGLPFDDIFAKVKMDIQGLVDSAFDDQQIIFYDSICDLKGLKSWWQFCYESIVNKEVISIDYKEFDNRSFNFIVSPYALKEYSHRWFLICTNHDVLDHYYNIPLDRIENMCKVKNVDFIPNDNDIVDYYDEIYGITNYTDEVVEHIKFVAYGLTAKYIESKPFYPYCKFRWLDDGSLEVRLDVKLNYELEHLLLSWSDSIKILEPKRLVDKHVEMLKKAIGHYTI